MVNPFLKTAAMGFFATILAGAAFAQQSHSAAGLSDVDKDYQKATAQSNLEEIQLAPARSCGRVPCVLCGE